MRTARSVQFIGSAVAAALLTACSGGGSAMLDAATDGASSDASTASSDCWSPTLQGDVVLNFDLRAVHVHGMLTMNGQPIGSGTELRFTDRQTNAEARVIVQAGQSGYAAVLSPSHYDVTLGSGPTFVVASDVDLTHDTTQDFSVTTYTVHGAVQVPSNMPAPPYPIVFRSTTPPGTYVRTLVGSNAGASYYSTDLPAGTYSIEYSPQPSGCFSDCAGEAIPGTLTVTGNQEYDIVEPLTDVNLTVTLDGQPAMTGTATAPPILVFDPAHSAPVPTNPPLRLLPGTYVVVLDSWAVWDNFGHCDPTAPWPCAQTVLDAALVVGSDPVTRTYDVRTARIQGAVTMNGMAPTSASAGAAVLRFVPNDAFDSPFLQLNADVAPTGSPLTFDVRLAADSYDVHWVGDATTCASSGGLPCNVARLESAEQFTTDASHDIDLHAVQFVADITLDGAPLPATTARGALDLASADGLHGPIPIPTTGAAHVAAAVLAGTYDIGWAPVMGVADPCTAVACSWGTLQHNVPLSADSTLAIDMPTAAVHGSVSINAAAFQPSLDPRDSEKVVFASPDGIHSYGAVLSGGSYNTVLVAGSYQIVYQRAGCDAADGGNALCGTQTVTPCE